MNWTTRRATALAIAACLTAISATALTGKHTRRHSKSQQHVGSAKLNKSRQTPTTPPAQNATVSNQPKPKPEIDRATHGRDLIAPSYSADPNMRGENIARTALAYRGVPYRFGDAPLDPASTAPDWCRYLRQWGIYLPRVAGAQFTRGTAIKPVDLQPGDLVFFQGTYKRGLSHVGIFIGEGRFVHAAGRGKGVRISCLSDSYFQKHWAGARRVDLKQLPKSRDEMPVIASEVIVGLACRPGGATVYLRRGWASRCSR